MKILDEFDTLRMVASGYSIARYGDGEMNLVRGGNCVSQASYPGIASELTRILVEPRQGLIVGVPHPDKRSPKHSNWMKIWPQYEKRMREGVSYGSAFITRPDSAPWIATDEYFDMVESLWSGHDVTMVYGSTRSLSAEFPPMQSAKSIKVVSTPYSQAYAEIGRIEAEIRDAGRKRVLLMCGPTATCLAARLYREFHAIDLGHIGMWWRAHENPKLTKQLVYMR